MPKIILPAALRGRMNNPQDEVEVAGATVGDTLRALTNDHPELNDILFTNDQLHPSLRVFVDDQSPLPDQCLATAVKEGSEIVLLPPIAGG